MMGFVGGLSLLLVTSPALAQITTLDSAGDVGDYSAVAIGADGRGLISYYDRTQGDLKVAHCSDASCSVAALSRLDTVGNAGAWTAIAVGGDGLGLVTYHDVSANLVKVAHCVDLPCTSAEISIIGAGGPGGITVGADGLGLVSWQDASGVVVVTHCDDAACAARTSTGYPPAAPSGFLPKVAVGPDGLGLVVYQSVAGQLYSEIAALHCQDVACTSAIRSAPVSASSLPPFYNWVDWHHNLAFGGDGRAFFSYLATSVFPLWEPAPEGDYDESQHMAHCVDPVCSAAQTSTIVDSGGYGNGAVAAASNGLGLWATGHGAGGLLVVFRCQDSACGSAVSSPPLDGAVGGALGLAAGSDGAPLLSYYSTGGADLRALHCPTADCQPASLAIGDTSVVEGDSGTAVAAFTVTLSAASTVPVIVDFATADGTATAPGDYAPASGTVTFAPGVTAGIASVSVAGDEIDEPDESFTVALANASNANIADGQGAGVILDDDAAPAISIADATVVEGDAGNVHASLLVSLSNPSSTAVGVDWQTDAGGGSATPGVDFVVANGSLFFAPGEVAGTAVASVIGDAVIEPDETFDILLTNPSGGTIEDDRGSITISDDDAPSLSFTELVHGSAQRGSLQASGPLADVDYYRLGQGPYSSWELAVDAASGGVSPLNLERLAADNVTVLQTGTSVSGGASVSMRWSNDTAFPVTNQHLSVRSGGCGAGCGANAGYRIRALETTARIARFNNSGTQVTVLVLENAGAFPLAGTLWFWAADGALLGEIGFGIAPHAASVVSTAPVAFLAGQSGTLTVTHDGGHGDLTGKAVAVEPATGFTFDTPLGYRPR